MNAPLVVSVHDVAPGLAARLRPHRHPDDLARPGLREASLAALDEALAAGAEPMTYAAVVGATALQPSGATPRLLPAAPPAR